MDFSLDISIKEEVEELERDGNENIRQLLFDVDIKVEKETETNDGQDWCVPNFESSGDLLEPLYFKQLTEPLGPKCALCCRYFADNSSLIKHNLSHLQVTIRNPEVFQCDHCAAYFTDKHKIKRHVATHLRNTNNLTYNNCSVSKTATLTYKPKAYIPENIPPVDYALQPKYGKIYLSKHTNNNSTVAIETRRLKDGTTNTLSYKPKAYKPKKEMTAKRKMLHQCNRCGKIYTYSHWHAHMREVHGEGGYSCGLCNIEFKCERYFTRHMKKTHREKIPNKKNGREVVSSISKGAEKAEIPCDECDAILQCRNALKTHKRNVHSKGEHICKICKSKLKCKTYLLAHMRRVHYDDGKKHECECGKKFKSPRYLSIHKKNTHMKKKKK